MRAKKRMLVLSMLVVAAGAPFLSGAARGGEISETADVCSANLYVARDANGNVRPMNFDQAKSYCQSWGDRLPTIRELALYSQCRGAQGISETEQDGYMLVRVSAGSPWNSGNFYYSPKGYQPPDGDLGHHWFWSSDPEYSDLAYIMYGQSGDIELARRTDSYVGYANSAVLCVLSR